MTEAPQEVPQDVSPDLPFDEPAAAVATQQQPQAPVVPTNGNGNHQPQPAQPRGDFSFRMKDATPQQFASGLLMNRVNNKPATPPDNAKAQDDSDYLDSLMMKAEAVNYVMVPHRFQPSHRADGTKLQPGAQKRGDENSTFEVMPYDCLWDEVAKAWGGGSYRMVFFYRNSIKPVENLRSIVLLIPTSAFPPKAVEYETIESAPSLKNNAIQSTESEEIKRERQEDREEIERDNRDAKKREREQKREKAELQALINAKQLAEMRRELLAPPKVEEKNDKIELLLAQIAADKKEAEAREEKRRAEDAAKEERRRSEEAAKEQQRKHDDELREERRRNEETAKELRRESEMKELKAEFLRLQSAPKDDGIKEMMLAMISRPPPPPPPDNTKELMLEMSRTQAAAHESSTKVLTAVLNRPAEDKNAPIMDLMGKMITRDKTAESNLVGNLITALTSKKSNEATPDLILKIMEIGEKRMERTLSMMQGNAPAESGEDGYDPAIGFLGNAGKALFSGIKQLMGLAATNPEMLEIIKQIVGKRTPTDIEIANAAYRMEHGGGTMPALPPYNPYQQQALPNQINQPQHPPARSGPPPLNPQAVKTEPEVRANELEQEASGLPSNADPVAEVELTPQQMAEQNIRDNVADTITIMIDEATAKPAERLWPRHATETWNRTFVMALCKEPDERRRFQMLITKCEPERWRQLMAVLQADGDEMALFMNNFRKFIDFNVRLATQQPIQTQTITPAPAQTIAANPAPAQVVVQAVIAPDQPGQTASEPTPMTQV